MPDGFTLLAARAALARTTVKRGDDPPPAARASYGAAGAAALGAAAHTLHSGYRAAAPSHLDLATSLWREPENLPFLRRQWGQAAPLVDQFHQLATRQPRQFRAMLLQRDVAGVDPAAAELLRSTTWHSVRPDVRPGDIHLSAHQQDAGRQFVTGGGWGHTQLGTGRHRWSGITESGGAFAPAAEYRTTAGAGWDPSVASVHLRPQQPPTRPPSALEPMLTELRRGRQAFNTPRMAQLTLREAVPDLATRGGHWLDPVLDYLAPPAKRPGAPPTPLQRLRGGVSAAAAGVTPAPVWNALVRKRNERLGRGGQVCSSWADCGLKQLGIDLGRPSETVTPNSFGRLAGRGGPLRVAGLWLPDAAATPPALRAQNLRKWGPLALRAPLALGLGAAGAYGLGRALAPGQGSAAAPPVAPPAAPPVAPPAPPPGYRPQPAPEPTAAAGPTVRERLRRLFVDRLGGAASAAARAFHERFADRGALP